MRQETPAWSAQARPGDTAWEEQVYRAYERRLNLTDNPIRNVGGSPDRMSPKAFRRWATRHNKKVTAWERRQAEIVARRFGISADEVVRIYCAVIVRHFTEGVR